MLARRRATAALSVGSGTVPLGIGGPDRMELLPETVGTEVGTEGDAIHMTAMTEVRESGAQQ